VVSFTFDDGWAEHATVAAPVLARHGMAATAYVMPDQIGAPGYLTRDQLRQLFVGFGWDVAAHHATPFTALPPTALEDVLLGVVAALRSLGVGEGFRHLAYPLGKRDPQRATPLARKHFCTARLAGGGSETIPPADPHALRAWNVTNTTRTEEVVAAARRARDHGEWLILMFHRLLPGEARQATEYPVEAFQELVAGVAQTGVAVRTVSAVWREADLAASSREPAPSEVPYQRAGS
jgi:peptidoglycan/xylan/chitin deacetylase (PgdA/CDA1 family)